MSFPTTLDSTSTIPVESSSTPLSTNHVTNHTASQTAIIALETKVGIDGSAVTSTHDYKLSGVTGTDKAVSKTGTETLTNKTLTSPTITGATITTSSVNGVTIQTAGSATDFLAANGTYQTGAVANSSTTVKGIVELATSAEVTAGTATGGTGAALVVTPDALASSAPTFSGANITGVIKTSADYHFSTVVTASANPRGSYSDSASSTISATQTAYTKFKEIQFNDVAGTITATWTVSLVSGGTGTIYTKIYKNGSAVGAEKTTAGAQTESTISVSPNDLIQVYAHMTAGDTATFNVNTFRLNYDKSTTLVPDYTTNTVNL